MEASDPTNAPPIIGAIDDHPALLLGLSSLLAEQFHGHCRMVLTQTVAAFLRQETRTDVVLLDLSLADGSRPDENVRTLVGAGHAVLLFTQEHRQRPIARALLAGAAGVVLKSQPIDMLADAINTVLRGEPYLTPEWAQAMDDEALVRRSELSPRELEALQLYATGMPLKSVARCMNVSIDTARTFLVRVRAKYAEQGRELVSRIDFYLRAVEDGHLPPPEPEA